MPRCIYCLQDQTAVAFTKREHVIPASMGSFQPLNPTLLARDGLVCDTCNAEVFSPLEVNFIEDTMEGVYGQRLNLQGRSSVTMRDKNFKIERMAGLGDKFFDEMFFFLKVQDDKVVPHLRDQFKMRRRQGGCRIFLPEALEAIKKNPKDFAKLSADLKKLDQKDMAIFAETREKVDGIIALLKDYGVTYKEKETKGRKFEEGETFVLEENYSCTVNHDVGRVLAKIAFNYFAYCALQSGKTDLLYSSHFDAIRKFAHADIGVLRDIIVSIAEEPILHEEQAKKQRLHAHVINFLSEDGQIFVRMTFFGRPAVYKILLGTLPPELVNDEFGCGHAFNPFGQQIMQLTQKQPIPQTEDQVRATFSLFNRLLAVN